MMTRQVQSGAAEVRTGGVWTLSGGRAIIAEPDGPATVLVPSESVLVLAVDLPLGTHAKRLTALATSGAKRSVFLPNLPTLAEAGVKDYEFDTWYGMHAPIKVSRDIIVKLNGAIVKALGMPEVKQQLANQGIESSSATPEEFTRYVRSEIEKMGRIIKASGARPE